GVETLPRLDHGIDVEAIQLAAKLDDVDRGRIDRDVDAEALAAAGGEERRQNFAVVVLGESLLHELDAALVQEKLVLVRRIDDDEAGLVVFEMPLDERKRAAANGAEADHYDRACDGCMYRPIGHDRSLLRCAAKSDRRQKNAEI